MVRVNHLIEKRGAIADTRALTNLEEALISHLLPQGGRMPKSKRT